MVESSIFVLHREGEGKIESGTLAQLGLHPDTPALFFNQPLGNGEPQACSTMLATLDLVKFIEDHLEFIFRDTHSRISHFKESRLTLLRCDDRNLTSIASKFECIGKEVNENIMNCIPIGVDMEVLRNINLDGEVLLHRRDLIDISSNHLREQDQFSVEEETVRFNPAQIQHLIHSHLNTIGIPLDGEKIGFQMFGNLFFFFGKYKVNIGLDGREGGFEFMGGDANEFRSGL